MASTYVRLSEPNAAYIHAVADHAGLSQSKVIDRIITEARTRAWTLEVSEARIVDAAER